jgi:gluconolactonase
VIQKTGRPNGLAVDFHGDIWVAESQTPSLVRVTMDGKAEVVATGCDGESFLFPNDLCFGPDGAVYMTDSGLFIGDFAPYGQVRSDYASIPYDGRVYRVDVHTGKVSKIDSGIRFTNGIAFGPDHLLYANETITGAIYRYQWKDGVIAGPRVLFGNVIRTDAAPGFKGRTAWRSRPMEDSMWLSSGRAMSWCLDRMARCADELKPWAAGPQTSPFVCPDAGGST